jgi:hypothetical protein
MTDPNDAQKLMKECARRSIELLLDNIGPLGFLAARPTEHAVAPGYPYIPIPIRTAMAPRTATLFAMIKG